MNLTSDRVKQWEQRSQWEVKIGPRKIGNKENLYRFLHQDDPKIVIRSNSTGNPFEEIVTRSVTHSNITLGALSLTLSLVSIWSSGSSQSSQSSQKMFRRSGGSYGNATQTIASDPEDWDDLDRLDRVEFYPDDRDDHFHFEAIMWKLPIAPVVRIVSKYFETAWAIGTIRTIIWKPGCNTSRL